MREITYCLSCKKDTKNIDPIIKVYIYFTRIWFVRYFRIKYTSK